MFLVLSDCLPCCPTPPCKPVSWVYQQHLSSTMTLVGHRAYSPPTSCDLGAQISLSLQPQPRFLGKDAGWPMLGQEFTSGPRSCAGGYGTSWCSHTLGPTLRRRVRDDAGLGVSGLSSVDLSSALRESITNTFHLEQIMDFFFFFFTRGRMLNQHENKFEGYHMCRVRCGHKAHQVVWPTFQLILSV